MRIKARGRTSAGTGRRRFCHKQHALSVCNWMMEESDEWAWASADDDEQSLFQKHIAEASELLDRPNSSAGRPTILWTCLPR